MEQNYEKFKIKSIFINLLLKKGNKSISEKKLKQLLISLKQKTKKNPSTFLLKSINNLLPKLKTIAISNKKRHQNKFFLMFLTPEKQIKTSFLWLFENSSSKLKNLDNEIIKTALNQSSTIQFKKTYYKNIKKLKFNLKY